MRFEVVMRLVIVLLLIVLPLILQIIAKLRGIDVPPPGPPRPPQPPKKPLDDEIGEFLRRAVEGRLPGAAASRAARPPAAKIPAVPPVRRSAEPVAAQVVEPPSGGDIGRHVQKFLDAGEFKRRSNELGEDVVAADKAMDQRVGEALDHRVGQLGGSGGGQGAGEAGPTVSREAVSAQVADLVSALCRPDSVRQAIIINEILRRPEDRWA